MDSARQITKITRNGRISLGRRSGHGLYLIREMIEISGMTLREVGVPGEGAVFEIRVPAGAFRLRIDDSS